eukprot:gene12333-13606_t
MSNEEEEVAICKYIIRIQKKIVENRSPDEKIVKYLHNLSKLPVSVNSLKTTGIGKVVNELKRRDGIVGDNARTLLAKWKSKFSEKKQANLTCSNKNKKLTDDGQEQISSKNIIAHRKKEKNDEKVSSPNDKPADHWKDVSLNLMAGPLKKVKKKRKLVNKDDSSESETKSEKKLPDTDKKKHVIQVRRDPAMPSLPEIQLPVIQRTYRPLHFNNDDSDDSKKKRKVMNDVDTSLDIISKKSRTQVFSGRRTIAGGVVPSLYQQCMKILIENMDALEDTGGIPFEILEPLLSKASPTQLVRLEEFNPYFTEDSGELWKRHCQKEFKGAQPEDMESYREMYFRLCEERAEKLKMIQSKISESYAKKDPARTAKLAYVASPPKPSIQMRRKQLRHGTGEEAERIGERQRKLREQLESRHREEATHTIPFNRTPKRDRATAVEAVAPHRGGRPETKKAGGNYESRYPRYWALFIVKLNVNSFEKPGELFKTNDEGSSKNDEATTSQRHPGHVTPVASKESKFFLQCPGIDLSARERQIVHKCELSDLFGHPIAVPPVTPLIGVVCIGLSFMTFMGLRAAIRYPDVVWDHKKNPYPWNDVKPNENVKMLDGDYDISKLTTERPSF